MKYQLLAIGAAAILATGLLTVLNSETAFAAAQGSGGGAGKGGGSDGGSGTGFTGGGGGGGSSSGAGSGSGLGNLPCGEGGGGHEVLHGDCSCNN